MNIKNILIALVLLLPINLFCMEDPSISLRTGTSTENFEKLGINFSEMSTKEFQHFIQEEVAKKNVNIIDQSGTSALSWALSRSLRNIAELLIKAGADPNIRDNRGKTSVHYAQHINILQLLLNNKANPNIQDKTGKTILMWAIFCGDKEIAKLLINTDGINLDIKDNEGNTALHYAAQKEFLDIIKLLINKGADTTIKNCDKATFLDRIKNKESNKRATDLVKVWEKSIKENISPCIPVQPLCNIVVSYLL